MRKSYVFSARMRLFSAIALLVIVSMACGFGSPLTHTDASTGSSLRFVWVNTYNQSTDAWNSAVFWAPFWAFLALMFGGILLAFFFTAYVGNKWAFVPAIGFVFVVAILGAVFTRSSVIDKAKLAIPAAADSASDEGINKKKEEVAYRYAELLNYQAITFLPNAQTDFTRNSDVVKVCEQNMDSASNCWPYEHEVYSHTTSEEHCSEDEDGNESCYTTYTDHYWHRPWTQFMVKYATVANLPDKYSTPETGLTVMSGSPDNPYYFSKEWMIPDNFTSYWYDVNYTTTFNAWEYQPPVDWLLYRDLLGNAMPAGITSWHRYSNPLLATANEDFVGDAAVIARLGAAKMLLEPRDLYSPKNGPTKTYFDFVYPLGNMETCAPNANWAGFTEAAQSVNMYYGNVLHISNSFAFACETEMQAQGVNVDDLIYNIKADMYNEQKWSRVFGAETLYTIMQQNTILVVCGVANEGAGAYIRPDGCRVMSGLPIGNETLKEAFASGLPAELKNDIAFTPEAFFGTPRVIQTADGKLMLSGTEGTPMYLWEVYGAKKPSMGENFAYLIDRIKLTDQEIGQVISAAVAVQVADAERQDDWAKILLLVEIGFVLFIAIAAISQR